MRRPKSDFSGQSGARLRRTNGPSPKIAVSTDGMDEVVAQTDQASSVHGEIRQLPAFVQVACWGETETTRISPVSGKRKCSQRRLCAIGFFDKEARLNKSDTRRRENKQSEEYVI